MNKKNNNFIKRQRRIRSRIVGTKNVPRLAVFRSLKHIYAQLIDDEKSQTLISISDSEIKSIKNKPKKQIASEVGALLAQKAKEKKIEKIVFDRRGYKYHGRVKELADGARSAGLKF